MAFGVIMTSFGKLLAESLLETAKAKVESYLQTSPSSTKGSLVKHVKLGLDCCLFAVSIWRGEWNMGIGPDRHVRRWPLWDMQAPKQDQVVHHVSSPFVAKAFCGAKASRQINATTKKEKVTCTACVLMVFFLEHETTTL